VHKRVGKTRPGPRIVFNLFLYRHQPWVQVVLCSRNCPTNPEKFYLTKRPSKTRQFYLHDERGSSRGDSSCRRLHSHVSASAGLGDSRITLGWWISIVPFARQGHVPSACSRTHKFRHRWPHWQRSQRHRLHEHRGSLAIDLAQVNFGIGEWNGCPGSTRYNHPTDD
jgi:hypothetical protein